MDFLKKLFSAPEPAPQTEAKETPAQITGDNQQHIDRLAQQMVYLGAQPDTTTAAERIDTVSTQKGYGDNIISAIQWETNEQLAADEHRQTPKQKFNNAVLERQIAEKKAKKPRSWKDIFG